MEDPNYKIVFMGTPSFAVPSLMALLQGPDEVVAVVTQPDRPSGRGKKNIPGPVKIAAQNAGIPVLQPENVRSPDFISILKAVSPDILVVVAYGQILPQAVLDIPRIMSINVHGSLLPKYRGAAPIQWAILNGEEETGISIMQMDAGMDTGPVLLKEKIHIGTDETAGSLAERLSILGAEALMKVISMLKNNTAVPVQQPEEGISYAPPFKPDAARIDWTRSAKDIHRFIRAFDPKLGAYTLMEGKRLKLFRPRIIDGCEKALPGTVIKADEDGIAVATGHGCLLIHELLLAGKKRLSAAEFLRGHPIPKGMRFDA
ncbi:MAG: methionyl-tRNA formyltransferase [Dissulfurimicrobium sp.]|uniref:methionyl-tRNA formyltransferase n=1 Tax=Dissulfurimicrobium sp. TaxID=2022436 RepID=UPI00404A4136